MFDPNIKVKVIADFKYKDESFVNAQTYLSFDIYDSTKIAELVELYNPSYSYKEFLELPSIVSLPYHVQEQVTLTYSLNKPKDQDYIPVENKPFYEVIDQATFSPFGNSPHEDPTYNPKPLADNTYEPVIVEPKFPEINDIKPAITEVDTTPLVTQSLDNTNVDVDPVSNTSTKSNTISSTDSNTVYTDTTNAVLKEIDEELQAFSAADIKAAVLELDPNYVYTNKAEAIKYIITSRANK